MRSWWILLPFLLACGDDDAPAEPPPIPPAPPQRPLDPPPEPVIAEPSLEEIEAMEAQNDAEWLAQYPFSQTRLLASAEIAKGDDEEIVGITLGVLAELPAEGLNAIGSPTSAEASPFGYLLSAKDHLYRAHEQQHGDLEAFEWPEEDPVTPPIDKSRLRAPFELLLFANGDLTRIVPLEPCPTPTCPEVRLPGEDTTAILVAPGFAATHGMHPGSHSIAIDP